MSRQPLGLPLPAAAVEESFAIATFSAGDARFLQPVFDEIKYLGVKSTTVGVLSSPGSERPLEALRVAYDPKKLS